MYFSYYLHCFVEHSDARYLSMVNSISVDQVLVERSKELAVNLIDFDNSYNNEFSSCSQLNDAIPV